MRGSAAALVTAPSRAKKRERVSSVPGELAAFRAASREASEGPESAVACGAARPRNRVAAEPHEHGSQQLTAHRTHAPIRYSEWVQEKVPLSTYQSCEAQL